MTGAGFGGCTVNLVRPDAVDALRDAVDDRVPGPDGPDAAGPPGHGRGWGRPADLIDASATSATARPSSPGLHDICDVRAHALPPRFARVRHA